GCFLFAPDPCQFKPISHLPVAAISAPRPPLGAPYATGACPSWVRFDGFQYTDTGLANSWRGAFDIAEADLTPIGRAEGATIQAGPFSDDTVYAIRGVDPADAVAMRYASGEAPFAVLMASYDPPPELCPYFKEPIPSGVCRGL
ncbi:MAG TPA: DUF6281 family protein, partial [Candidatus Limnocylindria bacterium]|nr:DUF6281 family protein [Candidatus Limnocylindria bacterium]